MRKLTGWCLALAIVGFGASTFPPPPRPARSPLKNASPRWMPMATRNCRSTNSSARKKTTRNQGRNRFGKLDKDGDKALTLEEFSATPKKKPK